MPSPYCLSDDGRPAGAEGVRSDPFNCLGPYSDGAADPDACAELRFLAQLERFPGTLSANAGDRASRGAPHDHFLPR